MRRHLLVTNDFPPKIGGIQSYLWELWKRLPSDDVGVYTTPYSNSKNFVYQHTVIKDNVSKLGVIVSLETSEKNEEVNQFGKQLSMHIAASNPLALNSNDIQKELIDKEQKLIAEELKNSGKPDDIAKKISLGKMNKFKEENALLTQAWVMEPKKKVQDVLKELAINDLKIKEFSRIKIGE